MDSIPQDDAAVVGIQEVKETTIERKADYKCSHCNKIFKRPFTLNRHEVICKELRTCHICKGIYSSPKALSKHQAKCIEVRQNAIHREDKELNKIRMVEMNRMKQEEKASRRRKQKEEEEKQVVRQSEFARQNEFALPDNQIPIVYCPKTNTTDDETNAIFITDHIDTDRTKYMRFLSHDANCEKEKQNQTTIVVEFISDIFKNYKNRCFYKKPKSSEYSYTWVHVDKNVWTKYIDSYLYRRVIPVIVEQFESFIKLNYQSKNPYINAYIKKDLVKFLDYMTEEGFINTQDLDIVRKYQTAFKDLVSYLKNTVMSYSNPSETATCKMAHKILHIILPPSIQSDSETAA